MKIDFIKITQEQIISMGLSNTQFHNAKAIYNKLQAWCKDPSKPGLTFAERNIWKIFEKAYAPLKAKQEEALKKVPLLDIKQYRFEKIKQNQLKVATYLRTKFPGSIQYDTQIFRLKETLPTIKGRQEAIYAL